MREWSPKLTKINKPVIEEEFRPQAPPPKTTILGKVLGQRAETLPKTSLPPIQNQVRVPTGEKKPDAPPEPPPITVDKVIIEEAEAKAAKILQDAGEQAAAIINQAAEQIKLFQAQALQQAEQAKKDAYALGLDEGRAAGKTEAQQEYVKFMLMARDLYVQAIKEREKLLAAAEPELTRLSLKIAEKIVGIEIQTNGEVIMGVIKSALSDIKDREKVTVRVAPDDYPTVNAERTAITRMAEGLRDCEVVIDSKIEQGGCIIETDLGNIDARLSTQLAAINLAFGKVEKEEEEDGAG